MEELQKLYDVLVREGKYTKSFDEFQNKWKSDQAYQNKVYGVVKRDGLYTKDINSFLQKYSFSEPKVSQTEESSEVKKKVSSELPKTQAPKAGIMDSSVEDGSLVSQEPPKKPSAPVKMQTLTKEGFAAAMEKERKSTPKDMSGKPIITEKPKKTKQEKEGDYLENLGENIMAGLNDVNQMITSIPETTYNVFSIPQNAIAYATGWDISTNSEKFKKNFGVENPALNYYKEEGKRLEKEISEFNKNRYESSSVYENIEKGNYQDAFELLGSGIARSAPTSIALMAGGAALTPAELATVSTAGFYNQNLEQLQEENPDASDIENNIKALGMSAAESVFSAIGEGQIGAVYRDIIKREGAEVGKEVFKDGLVQMYKGALEKYGVPVGLLGEGIEESATQITQNMISGKPAFEGAADAFILGGGSGAMFTAPISLKNAKDRIKNKIVEIDDKKKINTILEDSEETLDKVFDVSKDSEINEKQLSIASLSKSRDLLVKDLSNSVKNGDITQEQAKQSLYVFDKTKQITGQLRDIDVDDKSKVKIANLLKERESLSEKISGKDEALSVLEKQRIADINEEIKQTILKSKEDAIQEQATDEGVLRPEQSELGLQEVGEGDTQPIQATEETITTTQPEEVKEPVIVVHGAVNGFGLQYSEGIDKKDIVTPKDARGFLPQEDQVALNKGNSVIQEDSVLENGDKKISIITPATDNFGRSAANTFEFVIPLGNRATAKNIQSILDNVRDGDLNGKELIDKSVKEVKKFLDFWKPTEQVKQEVTPAVEAEVSPVEKIKGGENLSSSFLNDKQLTFQEGFDLANSELKEIEAKERTLSVQKEYEGKIKEINRIKELAAKASETTAETVPAETIDLEQITKNSYVDRISRHIIEKIGNNWFVKTEVEGKELFKSKTLKAAKEFVSNDNQEALRVQPTEAKPEAAPAEDVKKIVENLKGFIEDVKNKKFPNAIAVVEKVLPKNKQLEYKELYELAARNGIKINIERGSVPYGSVAGWQFNMINIDPQVIERNIENIDEFVETLNHEIIHGLLSKGIKDNYKFNYELKSILEKIQDNFDKASPYVQDIIAYIIDESKSLPTEKDIYGATDEQLQNDTYSETANLEELITYAFTNTEFAKFLESIPSNDVKGESKTVFGKLKEIIRNYIQNIVSSKTALDDINIVLDKYFDTSWNEKNYVDRNEKYNFGDKLTLEESQKETTPAEVDKIKSDIDASKERLKKAWDKYKTIGIAFDPKSNLAKDRELVKALVEYAYNNIRLGSYTASKMIEDLASQGFEMTRDGAKFIIDKASRKVQREIDKNIGIKPKPTEQKRINKAYSIGVATQKVATEEAKAEIKDLKAQVVDVFKAGIEAVRLSDAEAKEKARAQKQIADELTKKIKDLASTGRITVKQAANIIRAFGKVDLLNKESVDKFTDYMSNVFEKAEKSQVEQQKEQVLSKMMKLVSNKAKTAITQTGKRRTSGLDAQGQSFFVAVKEVLKAFTKNDQKAINKLTDRLSDQNSIDEAISKELRGEPLTTEENMLLNRALAFDLFSDISNKSYEEIKSLYDGLIEARALSIQNLKKNRLDRAAQLDTLRNKADNQVKDDFGILFNSDGTLKTANQLRQEKEKIFQNFRELKIWEGVKGFVKAIDITTVTGIKDYFRNRLSHIGTLTNLLDKSGTFFTDNIYRPLNQMEEKYLKGYYEQTDKLNEIASSIKGIKSYRDITKKLYSGVKKITINGKENLFNADQLLRIYALSKNDIQRKKLESMGIDNNVLDKIKKELDPSVIEFADKIVDYFSNEYFESVNKVYSKMNDVNLGYVENYFPTKTLQKGVSGKLLEDGDFNGIFNAETAPALKERTDVSGEIDLSPAFTDVLDNHFQTVERYKAYAEGVRKLNQIFSLQSVNTLINEVGIKDILKRSVNLSINPSSGLKERQTFIGRAMNKFTSFALAYKIWQIPKQATSFINAYEDYQFLKGKNTPGLDLLMFMIDSAYVIATLPKQIKTATDMSASFRDRLNKGIVGDSYTMESGSRLFRPVDKSSSLISKIRRGFKLAGAAPTIIGDIIGVMGYMVNHRRNTINNMDPELALEKFNNYNATAQTRRGTEKIALQQSQNDLTRAFTMFGSTTFLMINKVASAQTNIMRSLGKGEMPNQKDIRSLVLMLGLSNAMFVLTSNIGKFIYGDDDDKEEVYKSMFEAMVGLDLIFSIPLIGAGLETAYRKAMGEKVGLDLISSVPLIGAGLERAYRKDMSEKARVKEGVNPYVQVFNKIKKGLDSKEYMGEVRPIIEFVLGAQLDPAIGLYNYFYSEKEDPEAIYDILGIAPSYRPKTQEEQEKSKKEKSEKKQTEEEKIKALREVIKESDDRNVEAAAREMIKEMKETDPDKLEKMKEERKRMKEMKESLLIDEQTGVEYDSPSDMKKYNRDLWEKNFGEESQWYKKNGAEAEAKRMMNKIRTKEEEEEFDYTPKKKRKSRFSLGRYRD